MKDVCHEQDDGRDQYRAEHVGHNRFDPTIEPTANGRKHQAADEERPEGQSQGERNLIDDEDTRGRKGERHRNGGHQKTEEEKR